MSPMLTGQWVFDLEASWYRSFAAEAKGDLDAGKCEGLSGDRRTRPFAHLNIVGRFPRLCWCNLWFVGVWDEDVGGKIGRWRKLNKVPST